MKSNFGKSSISKKLSNLLLLTSCSALLLSSLGFGLNDWLSLHHVKYDRLHAQASIISYNTSAAIEFLDKNAATETLQTLKNDVDIVGAAIYSTKGKLFAFYERKNKVIPIQMPSLQTGELEGNQS